LVVAIDRGVDVDPAGFAASWDEDEEARALGRAVVENPPPGSFLPDVLALVVIPLVVNLASSGVYDLVRRLVSKERTGGPDHPELHLVEIADADGDRILVVRLAGTRS
jgi:hypothetical protein